MSPYLLFATVLAYAWTAIEQAHLGHFSWAGVWCSYAVANLFMMSTQGLLK